MGRRRRGQHPYDYTAGDDVRFGESGVGGTLRVLHGPGRGMGVPEGVVCRAEVVAADGGFVDESRERQFGKEHRLHGTVPGDLVTVTVHGGFDDERLSVARTVRLTGDFDDVVRSGVGPAWGVVAAIDTGDADPMGPAPEAGAWGAGVRLRGACADNCRRTRRVMSGCAARLRHMAGTGTHQPQLDQQSQRYHLRYQLRYLRRMAMTLRLDEHETEALRRRAELEGRSMQEVARQAVRDYIENTSKRELLDRVLDSELPRYAEALERLGQ